MTLTKILEAKLRVSYSAFARETNRKGRPGVRLPMERVADLAFPNRALVHFEGTEKAVRIRLNKAGIQANMQTDVASFDAWSLTLKVWCEVEEVSLTWELPDDPADLHYQRFLYRAERFRSLFDWFHIENDTPLRDAKFLKQRDRFFSINHPTRPRRTCEQYQLENPFWQPKGERKLEMLLCDSRELLEHYHLEPSSVYRQIPVGVFAVT
ncbi:MAG: hypothetical protein ABI906_05310 [Pseudomonadota bacterium]